MKGPIVMKTAVSKVFYDSLTGVTGQAGRRSTVYIARAQSRLNGKHSLHSLKLQGGLDPPPTLVVSFTGAQETCICGWDTCSKVYRDQDRDCMPDEKAQWKRLTNSHNTSCN